MISIKLQNSKNVTVAAYREMYDAGKFSSRDVMLIALAEDLLDQLTIKEEQEAINVSTNPKGTFVLHMPIQYMVENAKEKDKKVYSAYQEQLTKLNNGESAAMILPALTDENGNRMFTLEYVGPQKI